MRLLLAEDEKPLSKALTAILERNHYSVDAVYDGQEALEYLEADNYDGVILDIMMPKVDGLTVLKKIRTRGNLIPVLLLTAKSEVDDKVEGLDAGANDYLAKPFHSKELLTRIRAMTRTQTEGKFPNEGLHKKLRQKEMTKEMGEMSPEVPYESRYFSVSLDQEGNVIATDIEKVARIDETDAEAYAETIWEKESERGFTDEYRYAVVSTDEGKRIIFLDCGRSLSTFQNLVFTMAGVSAVGLLAVLVLMISLSARIVRPFSENYEKQKRFITDAGHELKTPLTIIDADAEILEMDFGENEWLADIQGQTKRLADLTNDLILLSRMEEAGGKERIVEFPLSDAAEETVAAFQSLAVTQNKVLESKIAPMVSIVGDEKAIRRLITILLDNAVKYSDEEGRILLTLEKQKKRICLTVYNTTESIAKEQTAHLFDRFYRTDSSRNSGTGGYGLGLSIAAATVEAHKGRIKAETEDEKSLTVTVTFSIA